MISVQYAISATVQSSGNHTILNDWQILRRQNILCRHFTSFGDCSVTLFCDGDGDGNGDHGVCSNFEQVL